MALKRKKITGNKEKQWQCNCIAYFGYSYIAMSVNHQYCINSKRLGVVNPFNSIHDLGSFVWDCEQESVSVRRQ